MRTLIVLAALCAVSLAAVIMSHNQMQEHIKMDFVKVDISKDGALELDEFLKFYNMIDHNHDGHLKEGEYMKMTGDSQAKTDFLYKYYDTDHNGDITKLDVEALYKKFDANGDGKVSYAEFEKAEMMMYEAMTGKGK